MTRVYIMLNQGIKNETNFKTTITNL